MRRNFLAPVPSFESFDALNVHLEQRCLERLDGRLRAHSETIGQRMERDLEALLPLPAVAYDACEKQAGRVISLFLVRYRTKRCPATGPGRGGEPAKLVDAKPARIVDAGQQALHPLPE